MEKDLISRQQIPFLGIPAAGVHGVGMRALPGNLLRLAKGAFASRKILREFQPDVLFFTGGYVAVPMALMSIPQNSLLFVPDIEPGLALKTLAHFADCIAVTAEESRKYFSSRKRVVVTGYPVRPEITKWSRPAGRAWFGIEEQAKVLLVFGGSKGARSINQALWSVLPDLLERMDVIHVTGQADWQTVEAQREQLPDELLGRYHAYPYLHEEMGAALAAADLTVCRAGASTLGELPHFGLPAVLVPYPYAWRYQKVNAAYLASHAAAVVVENHDLAERLFPLVTQLLSDESRLAAMRKAMFGLAQPRAAEKIADLLRELAQSPARKGGLTTW